MTMEYFINSMKLIFIRMETTKRIIFESVWYGTIGIVKVYNGFETKWYIGQGKGDSQDEDENLIADYGYPFIPPNKDDKFYQDIKPSL